jgi:hypothetical protein
MPIHDVIENLGTGVTHPYFVRVGIAKQKSDGGTVPRLAGESQLVPDVPVGLRDQRQDLRFENASE